MRVTDASEFQQQVLSRLDKLNNEIKSLELQQAKTNARIEKYLKVVLTENIAFKKIVDVEFVVGHKHYLQNAIAL